MAILEKLRVKAGLLLAIVIGLSLLAFVLSDFLDSGGSLFTRSKFEIAEVSGKSIPYTDFESAVNKLEQMHKLRSGQTSIDEATMDQIRNGTWDNMIQDMLLEKQYSKLGIDVSEEELRNLIMGENPHPAIAQLFTDPQTGILNRMALKSFMQRIAEEDEASEDKMFYLYLENEIYRQRKNDKYLSLLRKGLYATRFESTLQQKESTRTADLLFIRKDLQTVSDTVVSVSDAEIKKYYKEHSLQYKQKESRDIRYVYFEVEASSSDVEAAKKSLTDVLPDFEAAEDVANFVSMESDEPFDTRNYSPEELPDSVSRFMFSGGSGILGPVFINNSFCASRLAAVHYLPDSVKARHILLRPNQGDAQSLYKTADSLANLIKAGADFFPLAIKYSADGSAQTGGDLGWFKEGQMVKPFNDSCFSAKPGDVKIVPTQFGLHIIQIQSQSRLVKKVQVGTLVKKVMTSEETDHSYYVKANEFAGVNNTFEKFNAALGSRSNKLHVETALQLSPMEKRVNDIELARSLVTWAYKAEEHEISPVLKFGNKYVVAVVDKVREEGPAPLADVKAQIENQLKKQKKAEEISAEIKQKKQGVQNLEQLAQVLKLNVYPFSGLRFISSTLGDAGAEPVVIATAMSLEKGVVSEPVIGENGVYVLTVTNFQEPAAAKDETLVNMTRNYVERNYAGKANYGAYEALKELAKIKDNRREFF
jgi:peptidyl-prolyl cis-trans isomerase D